MQIYYYAECPDKADIMLSPPANIAYGTRHIPNARTNGNMDIYHKCVWHYTWHLKHIPQTFLLFYVVFFLYFTILVFLLYDFTLHVWCNIFFFNFS